MVETDRPEEKLLTSLQERAKELNCLYEVERVLAHLELPVEDALQAVVDAIPPGLQYPDVCRVRISYGDRVVQSVDYRPTQWMRVADIMVQDEVAGQLCVCYLEERPREDHGPFLKEEGRLINTIAERIGHFILYQRLSAIRRQLTDASEGLGGSGADRWRGPVDVLRRSDRQLFLRVARKMVNHLCWAGVDGSQEILDEMYGDPAPTDDLTGEVNVPGPVRGFNETPLLSGRPFELASAELGHDEIFNLIQAWIVEDKASFLPKVLNNPKSTLSDVSEGLNRFHHLVADGAELSQSTVDGLTVSLIRRFLSEQLDLITVAKRYLQTSDFMALLDRVILSSDSHGKLGGKTTGLFLAERILDHSSSLDLPIGEIKIPKSWYVASEEIMNFIEYNNLEEVLQQKYREIEQVRHEYPNIVELFKSSRFPPDIVRGLSMLLDEVGETPIIVRSSSLLEDRHGSAFSGKYKSLFLANQGSKDDRLRALLDAITEVYASVFGPDPIAYRWEKGLLDFHEEMAILIQEVVGRRVGDYFFPAVAGVAFSNNEFRWSPRIRREDGLIRLVPGLGTRAVDRVSNDYPVLAVPGQPNLRVNTTIDEVVRYSPAQIDVLNLADNTLETLELTDLLRDCGTDYPDFGKVFSVLKDETLHRPVPILVDMERDKLVADFNGLISGASFVQRIGNMLKILEDGMGCPVDIEFAYDGEDFYLLQCRPQSFTAEDAPAPIPRDIPDDELVFSAGRYISNGHVPDITHIVYVDPDAYGALSERADLLSVGQAISRLNKLLPKRQFILMGPGRWGSRGDVRLGVNVTYSDINNTAVLLEIARQKGSYVPDLSFGTHFFQDLVESAIRYIPLYPDDAGGSLNEKFLLGSHNVFSEMVPEFSDLENVVHVIDVPMVSEGRVLRVLMNADLDEAAGLLAPSDDDRDRVPTQTDGSRSERSEEFWRWRMRMVDRIGEEMDAELFGVRAFYVIGSTKNANAGPSSDIDVIVHLQGTDEQRQALEGWLDGWSLCLGEVNYLRTGYSNRRLLDVHIVTDDDIARRTSFAVKIGAVTDPAMEIPLGPPNQEPAV